MPDLKTSLKAKTVQWVLAFAGGGAGLILGMAAIEAFRARPEFLPQLVGGGGLWFAALVVGMVMFRSELKSFNATQTRSVVAQERLAENVGALVQKDDERAREQDLLLDHLASQSDTILKHLQEMRGSQI